MEILFIAPLPPPVTGHSLAAQVLLESLAGKHRLEVVDLSAESRHDGSVSWRRIVQVARVLRDVWRKRPRTGIIYLTISESLAGNIKDLLIYQLCSGNLSSMFIHLHGGSIGRELFERRAWLRNLNARFISRLGGVIVTGPAHVPIFAGMIAAERVHVVANFAQDYLFLSPEAIADKFASADPLRVLYLSSMTQMKGCDELADAYLALDHTTQQHLLIDFAGKFDSEAQRLRFERKIAGVDAMRYHGIANPEQKQRLFAQAHVFCLPTAHFEGQPISILEAYASGCVVLATGQSGIRDVFTDAVNGFEIAKSAESIAARLRELIASAAALAPMALANRQLAGNRYTATKYEGALTDILAAPYST